MQNNRPFSITTKIGDHGTTRALSGETLSKAHPRIVACGMVDELVSALGMARATANNCPLGHALLDIQKTLFRLATEISAGPHYVKQQAKLDVMAVHNLELQRRKLEKTLRPVRTFIVPGETILGAHLDLARTLTRRCECAVVSLTEHGELHNPQALIWLNRLSDLLWLMARQAEVHSRPLDKTRA